MNRAVIVAGALTLILGVTVARFMRDDPGPEPAANASAPPPTPRVVPKKIDSASSAAAPKKAAPKKTEPRPVEPEPAGATVTSLRLEADVPGASVFIDRQFVGTTPLTLENIEPGTRRLQLTATGFDSIQKTIEIHPGPNTIRLRIKEVSLDARATVVHKHGIGSCEGTLRASLEGLQYVTTHKGDAFTLSYAQLETFTVDYLDRNLRVKQRGGKTWNFTDRTDNGDLLFVFHRDVDAARKKLAAGYAPAQ